MSNLPTWHAMIHNLKNIPTGLNFSYLVIWNERKITSETKSNWNSTAVINIINAVNGGYTFYVYVNA